MIGRRCFNFKAREKSLDLGKTTCLMGIVNVTPDSFSADGQLKHRDYVRASLIKAVRMIAEGVAIVDIGGESTRPGAKPVPAAEEIRRVVPVIEALVAARVETLISVDTSKAEVAAEALKAGAHIVNVVRSNALSAGLLQAVRRYKAGIVLMHMRGTPQTMQSMTRYHHFIPDILLELERSVKNTLRSGIAKEHIILDPGIGFAKTAEQNFCLIQKLGSFRAMGFPILVGPSRKSFIGKLLEAAPSERLIGTVAAIVASVLQGAHIVRIHDVLQIKQAVRVADAILSGGQ